MYPICNYVANYALNATILAKKEDLKENVKWQYLHLLELSDRVEDSK